MDQDPIRSAVETVAELHARLKAATEVIAMLHDELKAAAWTKVDLPGRLRMFAVQADGTLVPIENWREGNEILLRAVRDPDGSEAWDMLERYHRP